MRTMKRNMILFCIAVLAICLYPNPAGAVDIMASGRYVPDTKEGGVEIQLITGVPIKGSFADHFFVVGGVAADGNDVDGYEGLLGVRILNKESRFNFGVVGGLAADILNLVNGEEAVKKTYGMATGGAFLTIGFSEKLSGVVGWEYFDPMDKENLAQKRHEFGVGLIARGIFDTD